MSQTEGHTLHKSHATTMDLKEMYSIATRQNSAWGIDGYQVPKQYLDPAKMAQEKKILEYIQNSKPIPAEKKYITKKRNFIDEELRLKNNKVGPSTYKLEDVWEITEEEKKKAKPKVGDRVTYIDAIFLEQKRRAVPGPGQYKIR